MEGRQIWTQRQGGRRTIYSCQHLPVVTNYHNPRVVKQHKLLFYSSVGHKSRMGWQQWSLLEALRENPLLCLFQFPEAACFPRLLAPQLLDLCFHRRTSFSVSECPSSTLEGILGPNGTLILSSSFATQQRIRSCHVSI